jgi:hypothetical protein
MACHAHALPPKRVEKTHFHTHLLLLSEQNTILSSKAKKNMKRRFSTFWGGRA